MNQNQNAFKTVVEQLEAVSREKQQQQKLYKVKIIQLENGVKQRDMKIISLSKRISSLAAEIEKKQKDSKAIESYLQQRAQSINKKELRILELQQKIQKIEQSTADKFETRIKELEKIVSLQREQINEDLKRHEDYLQSLQMVYHKNKHQHQEQQLLYEFNEELQRQIEEVENINEKVLDDCEFWKTQVQMQNQQGNDMLCQIQTMVTSIQ